jgi:hypothetical protein
LVDFFGFYFGKIVDKDNRILKINERTFQKNKIEGNFKIKKFEAMTMEIISLKWKHEPEVVIVNTASIWTLISKLVINIVVLKNERDINGFT